MPAHEYLFITRWRVPGTCEEVYEVLRRAEDLPRWWPSVYLRVTTLTQPKPGAHGLGGEVELHTKGWLPYTLRWRSRIVSTRHPDGFALEADGDFVGSGVWRFRQEGHEVDIEFDWRIRADKPFLRTWSWLLKPVFSANHRWAMRQGERSLRLELRRRRAGDDVTRADVPAPPRPTFVGWRGWLGPGLTMAGVLLLAYGFWPRSVDLRAFDPAAVGRAEAGMWRQYYEGRHFALTASLYGLNRSQYGFSPWDSLRLGWFAGGAAASFQKTRNREEAQAVVPRLTRYFALLGRRSGLAGEPAAAELARMELEWWQERRENTGPDRYGTTIAKVLARLYRVPEADVLPAARLRAEMMAFRDARGAEGMRDEDWQRIERELTRSYDLLRAAVRR